VSAESAHGHAAASGRSDLGIFSNLEANQLGVLIFVTSEAVFFLTLIVTYISYRPQYVALRGITPQEALNVPLTSVFTVFLLSSSLTMALATGRLGRDDLGGATRWLVTTVLFGAIFLVGQGYEYYHMYSEQIRLGSNLWTSTFFTLTGFHGLHVVIGLIAIATSIAIIRLTPGPRPGARTLESVSLYWHFVDAVWVIIFPTVYLWTLLS
jgi:heme/copper-type cytochrome/quinol oxidase subunit 3